MYESFGFEELTAPQAAVYFALILGALFGILAERTKFCFRRGLVGDDRKQALGVWMAALAVAIIGTQAGVAAELISFDDHRFMTSDLPIAAIILGGVMFGAGMVLTRGCASRLTILSATGNLRALTVLLVFAVTAHSVLKGALAPLRSGLNGVTVDMGDAISLANLPGGTWLYAGLLALLALAIALRSGNRPSLLLQGGLIGALVPLGWIGTGFILYDDFDPVAMESLAFTSPWTDTIFWTVAASSIPANFGLGLIGGTLAGAFLSALVARRLEWQSFSTPQETLRYIAGAVLMGAGGVLAGGCTIGAGLSGIPTLSVAALLTLVSITLGALLTNAQLSSRAAAAPVPAE
ncbi:putative inner membrane protein [Pelagimonas phthalicica]|uniref:Putative inner membrane protein n=1 Tax=Pelagimonas phthalicica TaxID=1037362 RepID=A0A238JF84_9RHOB|nr:YeeE/YedE family protein [Pelagimonas phthalicica]TDS91824.1 sulfur transporter [Pelagimonas phthalicica]SMX28874.1 putative inner membrane protein [Pelagimonas phthalicica]